PDRADPAAAPARPGVHAGRAHGQPPGQRPGRGARPRPQLTPGFAAGFLLGWGPAAAFILGGVTYISSSGIIAKMLGDLRRVGNRETPAILSILVIEDLVMAAYLPLAAAIVIDAEGSSAAVTAVVA